MKTSPSTLFALAAAAATAPARVAAQASFNLVALEAPHNWEAGPYLFPANVMAGYSDNVTAPDSDMTVWTEDSWAVHVLSLCESFSACTSSFTFQGMMSCPELCPSSITRPPLSKPRSMLTPRATSSSSNQ